MIDRDTLVRLNIIYFLREEVFYKVVRKDWNFVESFTNAPGYSIDIAEEAIVDTSHEVYQFDRRNLVYKDPTEYPIVVYKNGYVIPEANYTLDYEEGRVYFESNYADTLTDTDQITMDGSNVPIRVIDGYPLKC